MAEAGGALPPLDYERHRELLTGAPSEVLARLGEGDTLRLVPRCMRHIREHALLLQPERLLRRVAARVAHAAPAYRGSPPLERFVEEKLERSVRECLQEDFEAVRLGLPGPPGWERDYDHIAETVRTTPGVARAMCAGFNQLALALRQAFHEVVLQGKGPERYAAETGIALELVRDRVRIALNALSLAARAGFDPMGGPRP